MDFKIFFIWFISCSNLIRSRIASCRCIISFGFVSGLQIHWRNNLFPIPQAQWSTVCKSVPLVLLLLLLDSITSRLFKAVASSTKYFGQSKKGICSDIRKYCADQNYVTNLYFQYGMVFASLVDYEIQSASVKECSFPTYTSLNTRL